MASAGTIVKGGNSYVLKFQKFVDWKRFCRRNCSFRFRFCKLIILQFRKKGIVDIHNKIRKKSTQDGSEDGMSGLHDGLPVGTIFGFTKRRAKYFILMNVCRFNHVFVSIRHVFVFAETWFWIKLVRRWADAEQRVQRAGGSFRKRGPTARPADGGTIFKFWKTTTTSTSSSIIWQKYECDCSITRTQNKSNTSFGFAIRFQPVTCIFEVQRNLYDALNWVLEWNCWKQQRGSLAPTAGGLGSQQPGPQQAFGGASPTMAQPVRNKSFSQNKFKMVNLAWFLKSRSVLHRLCVCK